MSDDPKEPEAEDNLPDVSFGKAGQVPDGEPDDDDEEDENAPATPELIELLGFDPDDISE